MECRRPPDSTWSITGARAAPQMGSPARNSARCEVSSLAHMDCVHRLWLSRDVLAVYASRITETFFKESLERYVDSQAHSTSIAIPLRSSRSTLATKPERRVEPLAILHLCENSGLISFVVEYRLREPMLLRSEQWHQPGRLSVF